MRVMVLVKATKNSEAGLLPGDPKAPAGYDTIFEEMGKFNEELVKAGVMLEGAGLQASSKGARIHISGGKRTVEKGPFGGKPQDLIAGYWIINVGSLDEAPDADTLLIGIAPTGGKLPSTWRATILEAIDAGLDIHSGLHQFLGDDPEFAAAAERSGARLIDYRRPPDRTETTVGRKHEPGKRVILTVGTDCAIGKMSVALELVAAARRNGASAVMVPTGQTGMMIEGWGCAVDRVISDFTNGTVEWLVEQGESRGDWVFVEGQGSIDHPAYSAVTMGLIHGATPHAMVMVHKPGVAEHDFDHLPDASFPIADLAPFIELHERIAEMVAPSRVVAMALNTSLYRDDDEARRVIESIAAETGLPADDPVRFGADRLWPAIRDRVDALPWV